MTAAATFALFVSSIEGSVVTRYGTRTFIGAERSAGGLSWQTDRVIAIPHDEYRKFRREYDRALRDKSLRVRTETEWREQNRRDNDPKKTKQGAGTPSAPT